MKDQAQRRAIALVLAAATFAAAAPAAVADNSDQQVVATVFPGDTTENVTIGELEGGCQPYAGPAPTQVGPSPSPQSSLPSAAWSLGSVLGCLQPTPIVPAQITSVVITDAQGQPQSGPNSVLSAADLASPSDFLNQDESPLIYSDGSNIIYERPQRSANDLNAADQVQITGPAPFALEVFEQPALQISIAPSATSVAAGQRVSFNVSGVPAGDQATYSWNFGGGATNSTSATPNVTFRTAGVWNVTLTVTDKTAGSVGVATTTINVGATTPTQTSTTPVTVGPTKGNKGGTVGAPPRTTTTRTTTPSRTTPTRTTPTHTTPTRTTSTRTTTAAASTPGAGGGGAKTGVTPTPGAGGAATTATPRAATTTTPSVTTTPPKPHKPPHKAPATKPKPAPRPTQTTSTPQPSKPQGQRVSGLLLASLSPVSVGKSPLVQTVKPAAAGGAAPLSRLSGSSPWAAIGGGAAALLLLALGAGRELGVRRSRRQGD